MRELGMEHRERKGKQGERQRREGCRMGSDGDAVRYWEQLCSVASIQQLLACMLNLTACIIMSQKGQEKLKDFWTILIFP